MIRRILIRCNVDGKHGGCCYVFRFCLIVVCPGNRYGGGVGLMDPGRVTPDMGDLDSNGADNEDSAGALADKILREIVNAATSISIKVRLAQRERDEKKLMSLMQSDIFVSS